MKAIMKRIIKQFRNDRRTLALMLVAPLLIMTLIYLLLGDSDYRPKLAAADLPDSFLTELRNQGADTTAAADKAEGERLVRDHDADALIYADGNALRLLLDTHDPSKESVIRKDIQYALKALTPAPTLPSGAAQNPTLVLLQQAQNMKTDYLYGGADTNLFQSMGYLLLGILSFFFVFIIAGISFVRERTGGTMERMLLSPIRRSAVVGGYTLGFGFFAALQCVFMLLYSVFVLKMDCAGSLGLAACVMVLESLAAVAMGAFVSIFSTSEFQIMQFIPVVVVPQIFFSGMISLDTLPFHLGLLAKVMPISYACDALKSVLVKGEGWSAVLPDMTALAVMLLLFSLLNMLSLKRYRKI